MNLRECPSSLGANGSVTDLKPGAKTVEHVPVD